MLVLHADGVLQITDRSSGKALFRVGPFSNCKGPYKLVMMENGQLVLQGKGGVVAWASTSACQGNAVCYNYEMQVWGRSGKGTCWPGSVASGVLEGQLCVKQQVHAFAQRQAPAWPLTSFCCGWQLHGSAERRPAGGARR